MARPDLHEIENPASLSLADRLWFLARDSLIYGGASALNVAFSLITFPLLARHFSVADYGLVDLFSVVAAFLAVAFVFGQDSAVARFFYEYEDTKRRKQIVSQSLMLQLCVTAALLPLLWFAAGYLGNVLSDYSDAETLLKLILLQVPFQVLLNFSQNLLKWTFSRTRFILLSVGSVLVRLMLLIVAVVWFDVGVVGVFAIVLMVQVGFGMIGTFLVRHWITRPAGYGFLRELLPYALPYGLICSISAFTPAMERSIVSDLLGRNDLGLYAAGAKVAMLITLPIQAFQTAWGPFSLAIHKQANAAATYNWILKGFAVAICGSVLGLTLLAEPLIRLLASDRYAGAAVVVFPLAFGLAVQAISWITEIGIGLSKRSYLNLHVYAAFLLVSGFSVYFLAHTMGLIGASLGVMAGHIVKAVHSTYLAQQAYKLPWPLRRVAMLMTFTMLAGLLGQAAFTNLGASMAALLLSLALVLLLPLGWLWLFSDSERRHIASWVSSRHNRPAA